MSETGTALHRGVAQLLQSLTGRSAACAQAGLDFPLGRSPARRLSRGHDLPQAELTFDLAHQGLLPAIVVAVAGDRAVKLDTIDQQVHMFVISIFMPGHDVLVPIQTHTLQIAVGDTHPLLVR